MAVRTISKTIDLSQLVDGRGIDYITEWYQISNSDSTPPATPTAAGTGYSTTPMAPTDTYPYLWSYEVVHYTVGTPEVGSARVIGSKGPSGSTPYIQDEYWYINGTSTGVKVEGEKQRIYYRSYVPTPPSGNALPTTWVTYTGDKYNDTNTVSDGWSRKVTPIANGTDSSAPGYKKYLYLWTCVQKRVLNSITYSDILLDDSNTVIDGGNIVTGTIAANQIQANSLTIGKFATEAREQILNSNVHIGARNYALGTIEPISAVGANINNQTFALYELSLSAEEINDIPTGQLIISFDMTLSSNITGTSGTPYIAVGQLNTPWDRPIVTETVAGTYHKEIVISNRAWTDNLLGARFNWVDTNCEITFSNFKFEIGNKYTDWTPAPEDMASLAYAESIDDDVSGTTCYQYTTGGKAYIVQLIDGTYTYIGDDGEAHTVSEASLDRDEDNELITSRQFGAIQEIGSLAETTASQINTITSNLSQYVEDSKSVASELNDKIDANSLIGLGKASITTDSLQIIGNPAASAYMELAPTALTIVSKNTPVAFIGDENGKGIMNIDVSKQSTIKMRSQETNEGQFALVANSSGHLSLKVVD